MGGGPGFRPRASSLCEGPRSRRGPSVTYGSAARQPAGQPAQAMLRISEFSCCGENSRQSCCRSGTGLAYKPARPAVPWGAASRCGRRGRVQAPAGGVLQGRSCRSRMRHAHSQPERPLADTQNAPDGTLCSVRVGGEAGGETVTPQSDEGELSTMARLMGTGGAFMR